MDLFNNRDKYYYNPETDKEVLDNYIKDCSTYDREVELLNKLSEYRIEQLDSDSPIILGELENIIGIYQNIIGDFNLYKKIMDKYSLSK